ncbi:hypothetical protein HMPREF3039_01290 [Akkermansia sp. KLE1798]|nr:hypothetical protein HMPREF3039_01290 [Akkermansia sp. KLE1798]
MTREKYPSAAPETSPEYVGNKRQSINIYGKAKSRTYGHYGNFTAASVCSCGTSPFGITRGAEKPQLSPPLFVTHLDTPPPDRGRIISRKKRETLGGRHSSPNAGTFHGRHQPSPLSHSQRMKNRPAPPS